MAKRKKNIVTIGGGSGQLMLLSGLKKYPHNLTAIVSMADDGGSTGRLRDDLGVSAPGDVRQCLAALSDAPQELRELIQYRFDNGELRGHSFGNLLLAALQKVSGSFSQGAALASELFAASGKIFPVTDGDMRLKITLKNGKVLNGENELDDNPLVPRFGIRKIALAKRVRANKDALAAIKKADAIILGPSDLYGNIVPPLLVSGVTAAIKKSRAQVIYVCNILNLKGHTDAFDLHDYVTKLEEYVGKGRIDTVLYNTKMPELKKNQKSPSGSARAHACAL